MDAARWKRIQEIFHAAADLPDSDRRPFVEDAAAGDAGLVDDVLSLLDADRGPAPLLDSEVAAVADRVLGVEPPREIGPYRILGVLGEGGMGVVHLAERTDLGNRVAIKILRDASLSPARRERFFAEQRTLARLDHPLVARLYDADVLPDGTPWFAMEYVDGVPITEYCRRHAISIPDRLRLFRSVCEAVLYAHRHAVIHRDLKPSNLLVRSDGSVRLLDFGIAKHLVDDDGADRTRTAFRMLTPAYAAPEQLAGEPVGIHSDVYSLGGVLYELLTGRLPFDPSERAPAEPERPSFAARRLADSLPAGRPAIPARAGAWADLDVLCLTAMHRDPARRYRSVEALIRDVDHLLGEEPLDARPDSFRYRAGKFVARNLSAVLSAAAALAILIGVVAVYTARLAAARNAAVAESARTARIQRFTMSLFEGGDEWVGPSEDLRVVTLLDRGLREARALESEPEVQAELYLTLGTISQQLGRLEEADALLRSSLDRRRESLGPDHPAVVESLAALALLRVDEARLDEADRLASDALELGRKRLPAGHPFLLRGLTARGRVLQQRGAHDEAIRAFDEIVRRLPSDGPPSAELSSALTDLANTHFYAGNLDEAEALNRRVLGMDRTIWGERHPHVADTLLNLGAIELNRGDYADAERFDREALSILEGWYGPDHPETASSMTLLARALVFLERFDEAEAFLKRSLGVQERVYGAVHPRVASALNELAGIALQRDRFDDADALYGRMLEIYRSVHGERHHLVALALANQASVDLLRGEFARAERAFRDVVARYAETLSPDDLNTGIARIKLGRSLLGLKRYREAAEESLAGYDIVARTADPGVSWLRAARRDLVAAYEALGEAERATRFRVEQAALEGGISR